MMKFKNWVASITGDASVREIGRNTGYSPATVSRHINAANVQFCVDLAQAYNTNPLPGLIAAGAITPQHIEEYARATHLDDYTDLELAQEIVARLEQAESHDALTLPTDELATLRKKSNTTTPDVATPDYLDVTVREWDDTLPHAADSSPDEDQLREEEGASDIP